jgi:7-dehydrocholesterol reductase
MGEMSQGATKPKSLGLFPGREVLGPLFLTLSPPVASIAMWYANTHLDGSFLALGTQIMKQGALGFFLNAWPSPFHPLAWKIILGFMAFELALMRLVPGKEFKATATKTGEFGQKNGGNR